MRPSPALRPLLPVGLALALAAGCAGARVAPRPAPVPAPAPAEKKPVFATAGWAKPQEVRGGCVGRAFLAPKGWKSKGKVVAKLAIDGSGRVARFEDVSEPPDPTGALTTALEKAVGACQFAPGRDPEGRSATIWLLLTVPVVPGGR
jgi:hypothetical protein